MSGRLIILDRRVAASALSAFDGDWSNGGGSGGGLGGETIYTNGSYTYTFGPPFIVLVNSGLAKVISRVERRWSATMSLIDIQVYSIDLATPYFPLVQRPLPAEPGTTRYNILFIGNSGPDVSVWSVDYKSATVGGKYTIDNFLVYVNASGIFSKSQTGSIEVTGPSVTGVTGAKVRIGLMTDAGFQTKSYNFTSLSGGVPRYSSSPVNGQLDFTLGGLRFWITGRDASPAGDTIAPRFYVEAPENGLNSSWRRRRDNYVVFSLGRSLTLDEAAAATIWGEYGP